MSKSVLEKNREENLEEVFLAALNPKKQVKEVDPELLTAEQRLEIRLRKDSENYSNQNLAKDLITESKNDDLIKNFKKFTTKFDDQKLKRLGGNENKKNTIKQRKHNTKIFYQNLKSIMQTESIPISELLN